MNVTGPSTQHTAQVSPHALPVGRSTETPATVAGAPIPPSTTGNPAHLGNHVDTTA